MDTNHTNGGGKLIYPDLSYQIVGVCYSVHNERGRFSREKQYCDDIEVRFIEAGVPYGREVVMGETGNRADFLVAGKIVLEIKAKKLIAKDDFYQLQRYLQSSGTKLGLIVNFRNRYLKPIRVIRIDTDARKKFV